MWILLEIEKVLKHLLSTVHQHAEVGQKWLKQADVALDNVFKDVVLDLLLKRSEVYDNLGLSFDDYFEGFNPYLFVFENSFHLRLQNEGLLLIKNLLASLIALNGRADDFSNSQIVRERKLISCFAFVELKVLQVLQGLGLDSIVQTAFFSFKLCF